MNAAYALLTVEQTAGRLYKSEQGVRRLVKVRKLTAIREGGRLLITPESLQAYEAGLPHPVWVMAAISEARSHLTAHESMNGTGWRSWAMQSFTVQVSAYRNHFLPKAASVCRELLEAVKVKDCAQAEQQATELWRLQSDYQMLHAPLRTPHPQQPPLFAGADDGGQV